MMKLRHRLLLLSFAFGAVGMATPPKNVVLIVADDLGYHDLSLTGSRLYRTPNIDRLAASGIQFTQALSNSPVCSPARASLITGQFPSRHGITDWIGALSGDAWRSHNRHTKLLPAEYVHELSPEALTLPEAMRDAGYSTFLSGKWHLGGEGSTPEDHGFDVNIGGWEHGSPRGGYFDPYDNPKLPNRRPGEHLSMRLADETLTYIRQRKDSDKPVFAMLSFYAVHSPLQASQESWKTYRDLADSLGIATSGFEMGQYLPVRITQDNPLYAALVEAMDQAIGHVLDGLDEHTIVMFTSDHGGVSSGDAFATSNLPLRKGKGSTFEGGLRVPLIVRAPGVTQPGTSSAVPVTLADMYPTLMELIDQPSYPEHHADGLSLVPLMKGQLIEERHLYWHYPHYSNQDGRPSGVVRIGDWKLILDYETDLVELYDLQTDPGEHRNLAMMYPVRADEMRNQLMEHLKQTGARFPMPDPNHSPEAEQTHLRRVEQQQMRQLERQRLLLLDPEYDPKNRWWGSEPTP